MNGCPEPKSRVPSLRCAPCILVLSMWLALGHGSLSAEVLQLPHPRRAEYRIAIHCTAKTLQLWRHTELIREYPIHVGKGGLGKRTGGDHKTPLGDYEISWMASRHSEKGHRIIDRKSWCRNNEFVYAKSGPKLEKLWSRSYGGNEAVVLSINYPNAKQRIMGYTGDCIHIHADKHHTSGALKKSFGCIHMFPQDARDLYEMVEVGTPVKIFP